jgi:hypothetical protein
MLIHRRRPRTQRNNRFKLRVLIGTEKIEMVSKNRILGLTFHERLNWKIHIKDVKARVTRKLNLLKSLFHTSWGSDQKTLLRIHQMIVLSTLRYVEEPYGSASCAVLRQLDAVHHEGVRLALGTFVICRTENLLCEAGLAKLDEIRKLKSTKSAIRILASTGHPIRPYFINSNKLDEYAMWPKYPQPLFIRTAEYLGETQIDIRRIEMSPRYNIPPWKPVNEKQFDGRLSAFEPETSSECYRTETARTLDENYGKHVKIYTDGSKMGDKVGYAII